MLIFRLTKATRVEGNVGMLPASTIVTLLGADQDDYIVRSMHTRHEFLIDKNKFDERFVRIN